MAGICETLRELLENPQLQESLGDAFSTGVDSSAEFRSIDLADHIRHARGIEVHETPFEDLPGRLDEVIRSLVIERLPQPAPITLEDLTSLAIAHLAGVALSEANAEEPEWAYRRFVSFALAEAEQIQVQGGMWFFDLGENWILPERQQDEPNPFDPGGELYEFVIWLSNTGFVLVGTAESFWEERSSVLGSLRGYCSKSAMEHAASEMKGVVESIAKSAQLCVTKADFPAATLDPARFTPIHFLTDGPGRLVMSTCLSAVWERPANEKDELLDRLRNAIVLLSQADQIAFDPVALSLSFSAIEALVCEERELPVNKQVKRHVTTLLVRDAASRKIKEKVIDKLYDIRSRVLHGSKIDWPDAYKIGRRVAAGVIRAVASWRENQQRVGGATTWKELMDELNAASRKPGMVVGVPDLSELIPDKVPS